MKNENLNNAIHAAMSTSGATAEQTETLKAATLSDLVAALNEDATILPYVQQRAAEQKKEQIRKKAEQFAAEYAEDAIAMFKAFIADPFTTFSVISENTKKGEKSRSFELAERKYQVSFYQVERAFQLMKSKDTDESGNPLPNKSVTIAADPQFEIKLRMFLDNLAKNIAGDLGAKAPVLTDKQAEQKTGDFAQNSRAALEKQLNAVVSAILPGEVCPKMIKADVKFLGLALTRVRYTRVTMANEKGLMNALFAALKVRTEKAAYDFQSKARCHRAKKD